MTAWPLDVDLALEGYLAIPGARRRHVYGVDRIVAIALRRGVTWFWVACLPSGRLGESCCWTRRVLLAEALIERAPWRIRDVLSHELGHCLGGPSCQMARRYQVGFHADAITPDGAL